MMETRMRRKEGKKYSNLWLIIILHGYKPKYHSESPCFCLHAHTAAISEKRGSGRTQKIFLGKEQGKTACRTVGKYSFALIILNFISPHTHKCHHEDDYEKHSGNGNNFLFLEFYPMPAVVFLMPQSHSLPAQYGGPIKFIIGYSSI